MSRKMMNKYEVNYFQCPACHFIQTEEPYWLGEAYNNAITNLDIGLVYRNEYLVPIVSAIINSFYNYKEPYLDYGGGYGLFVRMMRDRGFDFYRQDVYCENHFAKHFDIIDMPASTKFGLITAFEVFEHFVDPLAEIEKIQALGNDILFTTELQPENKHELQNWSYFAPEIGQHISLFSKKSLQVIAEKFQLNLYTKNNIHLLSSKKLNPVIYNFTMNGKFQYIQARINKRASFLGTDVEKVKSSLYKK